MIFLITDNLILNAFFFFLIQVIMSGEQKKLIYKTYKNKTLTSLFQNSYLIETMQQTTRLSCFSSCSKTNLCISLLYNKQTKECSLFSKKMDNGDMNDIASQENFLLGFKNN